MSKKAGTDFTPEIALATKEARELNRIRNSFTFNLGVELIRSIKNPFRIPLLPFRIMSSFFSRKPRSSTFENTPRTGILIIGIDRIGEKYSLEAQTLCETINDSNLGEISLFNNVDQGAFGASESGLKTLYLNCRRNFGQRIARHFLP